LGVLFLINCYRAATQSIVHDEALTWRFYLSGPASAFPMRLPALLAGA
jgi:hypothetical protein